MARSAPVPRHHRLFVDPNSAVREAPRVSQRQRRAFYPRSSAKSQSKAERGESIVRVHWRLAHTATRSRPMLATRSDRDHLRQSRATALGTAGFRFQKVPNRCVLYGATKPPPLSGGSRQRQRQIRLQRDDERSQSSPQTMQTPKALNGVSSRILSSYTCVARRANPLSRAAPTMVHLIAFRSQTAPTSLPANIRNFPAPYKVTRGIGLGFLITSVPWC